MKRSSRKIIFSPKRSKANTNMGEKINSALSGIIFNIKRDDAAKINKLMKIDLTKEVFIGV